MREGRPPAGWVAGEHCTGHGGKRILAAHRSAQMAVGAVRCVCWDACMDAGFARCVIKWFRFTPHSLCLCTVL